jgi:hypothetical protein
MGNLKDIEPDILVLRSRKQVDRIVRWVGKDKQRFAALMKLYLSRPGGQARRGGQVLDGDAGQDDKISRHAAWVVAHCVEQHPNLASPWLKLIVKKNQEPGIHEALRRTGMSVLQYSEIPASLQGTVANVCFSYITELKISIAPRAAAIKVLARIAEHKKELALELRTAVEQMLPYSTPAFRSCARHILKSVPKGEPLNSREEEDKFLNDWLLKKR